MTCKDCRASVNASKIKVEENGKKAVFLNSARDEYWKVRVDGCLVKNATAADYVVAKLQAGHVIVELKGPDIAEACEQIIETAKHLRACPQSAIKIAGLVVWSEFPKGAARSVNRLREKFAKEFKGPIHIVARNDEFNIERLLDFSGPK